MGIHQEGRGVARIGAAIAMVVLALAAWKAEAATSWTLVDIGTLGGPGSYGAALSDNGIVAGCSDTQTAGVHAFIYRDGVMQDLGTGTDSTSGNSCALAVNNAGLAAGRSASGELVVWNGMNVTRLGIHGNVGGMNNAGTIVGSAGEAGQTRAFAYDGTLRTFGSAGSAANAINARGDIVGISDGHAFLLANGTMRDLGTLGGAASAARGINERGQVVGMATNAYSQPTPFLYDGAMQELPGGGYAAAIAINARGQVIASAEGRHGYLVSGNTVTYLDEIAAVRALGWRNLEPTAINDQGWIVGTGINAEGDFRAFLLVPRTLAKPLVLGRTKSVQPAPR
jgi:probable HAF family extracellular repeat protein